MKDYLFDIGHCGGIQSCFIPLTSGWSQTLQHCKCKTLLISAFFQVSKNKEVVKENNGVAHAPTVLRSLTPPSDFLQLAVSEYINLGTFSSRHVNPGIVLDSPIDLLVKTYDSFKPDPIYEHNR